MAVLTLRRLRKAGACAESLLEFERRFGADVEITRELCASVAGVFDWAWAAECLSLSDQARAEYVRVTAPARVEYECVRLPVWAEYERAAAQARAEYNCVRAQAWAEYSRVTAKGCVGYERVRAQAEAEYERVRAQAWAECQRVADRARAEYVRVTAPARAEYAHVKAQAWADGYNASW